MFIAPSFLDKYNDHSFISKFINKGSGEGGEGKWDIKEGVIEKSEGEREVEAKNEDNKEKEGHMLLPGPRPLSSCHRQLDHIPPSGAISIADLDTLSSEVAPDAGQSAQYLLCVGRAPRHFHSIQFQLNNTLGDCDLFAALGRAWPGPEDWDWKSSDIGRDALMLRSYTSEFMKYEKEVKRQRAELSDAAEGIESQPFPLYFSVSSKDPSLPCRAQLSLTLSPIDFTEAAHKVGALRGGKVLLPRDLLRPIVGRKGNEGKKVGEG